MIGIKINAIVFGTISKVGKIGKVGKIQYSQYILGLWKLLFLMNNKVIIINTLKFANIFIEAKG